MTTDVDVQELARAIASHLDPDALWDSEDVARHIKRTPRYVTERLAGTPGFPPTIRLPTVTRGRGLPLWRRDAIVEWVRRCEKGRNPAGGRPRKLDDE